ncbi:peptidase A24A prepilin type IV [Beutenbergia cavernae DSM 12333]|uniref:Peptidase A24A prepilin type IV n=1 Tax=Beutenbergia cavernae (strain ATCC BAA-8 / DSM 12333 / CCUG 43141 / JCM 11478 / NBRC 16432 / NCIMB 13614 / HKI 0122) TaxID=471853 RepID=C5C5T2_BEUC1|nr:A24 family peptidase [Beutenbergia cavernae]ACQ80273.1 peptidase A24A prepilin type IV [Beutenbergia cavernae DSM 12333]
MLVAVCALLGAIGGAFAAPWLGTLSRGRSTTGWFARPVVAAVVGVVAAGAAALVGPRAALPATLVVALAATGAGLVDAAAHRIPNAIVLPAYPLAVVGYAVAALIDGDGAALVRALAGGAICWSLYALLAWVYPPGLGFGDVKLAGLLGIALGWFGWTHLVVGVVGAFVLGGLAALALLVTRRARRSTAIPFGPWMIGGAFVGAAWGPAVLAGLLAA